MTKTSSPTKQANPAFQTMLQKGIDAYMQEKNPPTESTRLTRSATKASAKDAESSRSTTPPKNNRTKNATDTSLPDSEEEKSVAEQLPLEKRQTVLHLPKMYRSTLMHKKTLTL